MKRFLKIAFKIFSIAFILLNVIVMFHAYKLTHYYEDSTGANDQIVKSGWGKAKELLFGFNASKRKSVKPDSSFKTVFFKTSNGLNLEAWLVNAPSSKGTVIMFHGHGGNKAGIINEAAAFRLMGYNTLMVDFRAHGNSEGRVTTIGYKESEDVRLAYDYVKEQGEKNIVLWGISLGAAAITKAIYDYDLVPSGVILEMPFDSLYDAVQVRIKMMGVPVQPVAFLLTFWGGVEQGFWAFDMRPVDFAKKIKCPVLLQLGKKDIRVTQAETGDIYRNIPGNKKLVIYENSGHESLYRNEPEKWVAEVSAFIQR